MSHTRNRFANELVGIGVTGGTVIIRDRTASGNEVITYERVVVENQTSNGTVVRMGIDTPISFRVADYLAAFNANIPQVMDSSPIAVKDSENLRLELTGTTTGDVLRVWVFGYNQPAPQMV